MDTLESINIYEFFGILYSLTTYLAGRIPDDAFVTMSVSIIKLLQQHGLEADYLEFMKAMEAGAGASPVGSC